MISFNCSIFNIQHIEKFDFSIDLSKNQLMCIVGKNGVGKTTLIRSIKNLLSADTFLKTASPYIFNDDSLIRYNIDNAKYDFKYNPQLKIIDTKSIIDKKIKNNIYVELPIPHGDRFSHFQKLSEIDEELRTNISFENYTIPNELISFLSNVYTTDRFSNLKEVHIKNIKYYFILKADNFYIREDYLSSGEHFVINLFKMIQQNCKLIIIDEIDISLDASAQVNLIRELRSFCTDRQINIVFSTHSLAIMKTLFDTELYYMENNNAVITLRNTSYNYVKSILFGFIGWDKYILTEDIRLEKYLTYLISEVNSLMFFKYKIIYIGGDSNVVDLMSRNSRENFLSSSDNVISVLDGDSRIKYEENQHTKFIPFESIEKQLFIHYNNGDITTRLSFRKEQQNGKELYNSILQHNYMSEAEIFSFINGENQIEVDEFRGQLINFLNN